MAPKDDLEPIIKGCKAGNSESFSKLVDLYAPRCYGYFYRLTGNKDISDDLLGSLFIRLVEQIRSYRGGVFEAWLFKVASNIFYDYLRAKKRRDKLLEIKGKELQADPGQTKPPDPELVDRLQVQLGKLDDDARELIMLRFYSELSFKEIAEIRSEPIGTILSKSHRTLKKLRRLMGR